VVVSLTRQKSRGDSCLRFFCQWVRQTCWCSELTNRSNQQVVSESDQYTTLQSPELNGLVGQHNGTVMSQLYQLYMDVK
jgi:hypothetical protein